MGSIRRAPRSTVRTRAITLFVLLVGFLAASAIPASSVDLLDYSGTAARVNVSSAGAEADLDFTTGYSKYEAAATPDGRFVVFTSFATNIVPGDMNDTPDVFLKDLATGAVTRVSVSDAEQESPNHSSGCGLTSDGQKVVFQSSGDGFVAGDTNNADDIFIRDVQAQSTSRVVVGHLGVESNGDCFSPKMTPDGAYIAFVSTAANLVATDTNGKRDVFVRDVGGGANELVTVDSSESFQSNGSDIVAHAISGNGRFVVFVSDATNLVTGDNNGRDDVFVRDRQAGLTARINLDAYGAETNGTVGNVVSINADGRYVAFSTTSPLTSEDTNTYSDVYVWDAQSGENVLASKGAGGTVGNHDCYSGSLSPDGNHLAFVGSASNLLPGNTSTTKADVFVRDLTSGAIARASVTPANAGANDYSVSPSMADDGRWVLFDSLATDIVTGDNNGKSDLFLVKAWSGTKLSLSAPVPARLASVKLTATLRRSDGVAVAVRTIAFDRWNGSSWTFIGNATTSSSGQAVKYASGISDRTTYRARFAESVPYRMSTSANLAVRPRAYVRTPIAPKTMSRFRSYSVWGTLKPRHKAYSYPVRIYRWKKTASGKWKSYGSVKARAYNYRGYTKYSRRIRLPYTGRWRLRAFAPEDYQHAGTWSGGYDYVTVR